MLSPMTISSPTFRVRTNIRTLPPGITCDAEPGPPGRAVPRDICLGKVVEGRRRDGPLVPDKTGSIVPVNQAASGEWGTEATSVLATHCLPVFQRCQSPKALRRIFFHS